MRLTEILKSSFATLRLNIRRTFLTMIGIIIGIAAVITIMSDYCFKTAPVVLTLAPPVAG